MPGAYEEETEALRFLDEFGTLPCLCELLLHDRTGGRRGLGTWGRACRVATVSGKEGRTGSQSLGGCQGAGVSQVGGWQPGWRQLWGSPSPSSGLTPHSTHNSVPVGRSHQTWPMARVGLGKLLASAKQPLPLGAGALWGWGQKGTELGAVSVTPQAARAPQAVHGPDLPEAPACSSCLWLLLWFRSCNSANPSLFSAPLSRQVPPKPWGSTSCCWGGCGSPFHPPFAFRAASPGRRQGAARNKHT